MNTSFFEKATDLNQDFTWKDVFSEAFKPHGKSELNDLLVTGIGDHVPEPAKMLDAWRKPWLFLRFCAIGVFLSLLILLGVRTWASSGLVTALCMIPPFVMPMTVAVFYWEMNVPRDISLYEVFFIVLLGGTLSLTVNGALKILLGIGDVQMSEFQQMVLAYLGGPMSEEPAKLIAVYLLLKRKKIRYGLQGVLVGGAVGVGFAAMESAGYAINYGSVNVILSRAVWAFGGHVVWAAMYGGALALAMQGGKLTLKCMADKLTIISFCVAYLCHTLWNFNGTFAVLGGILSDSLIDFLYRLSELNIYSAIVAVLPWLLLLHILRKCMMQVIAVDRQFQALSAPGTSVTPSFPAAGPVPAAPVNPAVAAVPAVLTVTGISGVQQGREFTLGREGSLIFGRDQTKASVIYPADTRGISSVHCEIKWKDGFLVLIDRGSSYGTFFGNGQKLEPNVPYKLQDQVRFYLASEENQFRIHLKQ